MSEDPQTFHVDVDPDYSISQLSAVISTYHQQLFLFSELGRIESIYSNGQPLSWTQKVSDLDKDHMIWVMPAKSSVSRQRRKDSGEKGNSDDSACGQGHMDREGQESWISEGAGLVSFSAALDFWKPTTVLYNSSSSDHKKASFDSAIGASGGKDKEGEGSHLSLAEDVWTNYEVLADTNSSVNSEYPEDRGQTTGADKSAVDDSLEEDVHGSPEPLFVATDSSGSPESPEPGVLPPNPLSRYLVTRQIMMLSPVLFIRLDSQQRTPALNSWSERPLSAYLSPSYDQLERDYIKKKRSRFV